MGRLAAVAMTLTKTRGACSKDKATAVTRTENEDSWGELPGQGGGEDADDDSWGKWQGRGDRCGVAEDHNDDRDRGVRWID